MNRCSPILLVEDNADDAVLLERALRRAGMTNPVHTLSVVRDAVQFLEKQRREVPIFVIINLDMFLSCGQEVLSWMKGQDYLQQVPVIAIGNASDHQSVQQAYDLGVNAYFGKQLDMNDLVKMIRDLEFLEDILPDTPQSK